MGNSHQNSNDRCFTVLRMRYCRGDVSSVCARDSNRTGTRFIREITWLSRKRFEMCQLTEENIRMHWITPTFERMLHQTRIGYYHRNRAFRCSGRNPERALHRHRAHLVARFEEFPAELSPKANDFTLAKRSFDSRTKIHRHPIADKLVNYFLFILSSTRNSNRQRTRE